MVLIEENTYRRCLSPMKCPILDPSCSPLTLQTLERSAFMKGCGPQASLQVAERKQQMPCEVEHTWVLVSTSSLPSLWTSSLKFCTKSSEFTGKLLMLWTEPATFSESPIPLNEHAILAVAALCRCDLPPQGTGLFL